MRNDCVRVTLEGRFLERLIDGLLAEGVAFGRIERIDERTMMLWTSQTGAQRLVSLAAQYGLKAEISAWTRGPALCRALKARWTLAASLLLAAALVVFLSGRIWRVELCPLGEALSSEEEQRLIQLLNASGVRLGAGRDDIDCAAVSAQIMSCFDSVTYAAVKLRGVCAAVEYRLGHDAPEVYEAEDWRSLYALRDAVVVSVMPLAGRACVKAGDTVRAGQRLIAGEERISAGETRYVRAAGEVIGRVWTSCSKSAPLTEWVTQYTGRVRTASSLKMLSWSIDLTQAECFEQQQESVVHLPVGGVYLPLVIERRIYSETEQRRVEKEPSLLEAELARQALDEARALLPEGASECRAWTQTLLSEGVMTVEAVIESEMNIAADAHALLQGGS